MVFLEAIMACCLVASCLYFSYTDIKHNIISNRNILYFGIMAISLDFLYYSIFCRDIFHAFITNAGLMTLISVVLYATHVWAAGDSKFLILIALQIPARWTLIHNIPFYEFMIVAYAFAAGFIFLAGDTINLLLRKKVHISPERFKNKLRLYMLQYLVNCIYILTLLKIEDFVLRRFGFQFGTWSWLINICFLILVSYIPVFHNRGVITITILGSLLYSIGTGIWMLNWERFIYYGIIVIFMIIQILIGEFNYRDVKTSDVQEGMVLSMATTFLFQGSRVKGLPGISTEDMKSRLTQKEAEAVVRWGKSKGGRENVSVVRKIPFGIFISIGTLIYLLIILVERR